VLLVGAAAGVGAGAASGSKGRRRTRKNQGSMMMRMRIRERSRQEHDGHYPLVVTQQVSVEEQGLGLREHMGWQTESERVSME
jgi:hypothetical protein